jgi:hypothetical protein
LDRIVQTTNLQASIKNASGNPLIISNLDENYQFKDKILFSRQGTPLASLSNGLTFTLTEDEDF